MYLVSHIKTTLILDVVTFNLSNDMYLFYRIKVSMYSMSKNGKIFWGILS